MSADPVKGNWGALMQRTDDRRVDQVIALAEKHLPLAQIARGPGTALGLGPEWAPHMALDAIVQDLRRFPGRGWALIATALRSPVTRNRNMAINALDEWGRDAWPEGAQQLVDHAFSEEPDENVKERLARLATGRALDDY